MLLATFTRDSDYAASPGIEWGAGHFVILDAGPTTAGHIKQLDDSGELEWASPEMRSWFYDFLAAAPERETATPRRERFSRRTIFVAAAIAAAIVLGSLAFVGWQFLGGQDRRPSGEPPKVAALVGTDINEVDAKLAPFSMKSEVYVKGDSSTSQPKKYEYTLMDVPPTASGKPTTVVVTVGTGGKVVSAQLNGSAWASAAAKEEATPRTLSDQMGAAGEVDVIHWAAKPFGGSGFARRADGIWLFFDAGPATVSFETTSVPLDEPGQRLDAINIAQAALAASAERRIEEAMASGDTARIEAANREKAALVASAEYPNAELDNSLATASQSGEPLIADVGTGRAGIRTPAEGSAERGILVGVAAETEGYTGKYVVGKLLVSGRWAVGIMTRSGMTPEPNRDVYVWHREGKTWKSVIASLSAGGASRARTVVIDAGVPSALVDALGVTDH